MWRFILFCLSMGVAGGQEAPSLHFEVAEIKVNESSVGDSRGDLSNGRLDITNSPLRFLIAEAWTTSVDRVRGPAWLDSVRVDIVAKTASPKIPDRDVRLMLQTLLRERMKLVAHLEERPQKACALSLWKGTQRMTPSEAPLKPEDVDCSLKRTAASTRFGCTRITMPILVNKLQQVASRDLACDLVDQTGLTGAWTFTLEWTPTDSIEGVAPSLVTALRAQLGLQLTSQKVPVSIVVVDSMERRPSEN